MMGNSRSTCIVCCTCTRVLEVKILNHDSLGPKEKHETVYYIFFSDYQIYSSLNILSCFCPPFWALLSCLIKNQQNCSSRAADYINWSKQRHCWSDSMWKRWYVFKQLSFYKLDKRSIEVVITKLPNSGTETMWPCVLGRWYQVPRLSYQEFSNAWPDTLFIPYN